MAPPGFSLSKSVLDRGAVSKYFASLQSAPEEEEAPAVLSRFDELEVRGTSPCISEKGFW